MKPHIIEPAMLELLGKAYQDGNECIFCPLTETWTTRPMKPLLLAENGELIVDSDGFLIRNYIELKDNIFFFKEDGIYRVSKSGGTPEKIDPPEPFDKK